MGSIHDTNDYDEEQSRKDYEEGVSDVDKMAEKDSYLTNLGYNTKGLTITELNQMFFRETEGEEDYFYEG